MKTIERWAVRGFAAAFSATLLALFSVSAAFSQAKLFDSTRELFIPVPDDGQFVYAPSPEIFTDGQPGALYEALPIVPALPNPVVAETRVGFFNASETSLQFMVKVETDGGEKETIYRLLAHEILTIDVEQDSVVTGTISTEGVAETQRLVSGTIYQLQASDGRWIFSEF